MYLSHDHDHSRPIRYFKLRNSGGAVIHFLIKDSTDGRTVWDGGPTLAAGSDATVDLSTTPGVEDKNAFRFGAYVTAGRNATDKHAHPTDFNCDTVGVWKWTGSTIAGSKVTFEGYEKHGDKSQMEVLAQRVELARMRIAEDMVGEEECEELEVVARHAANAVMQVLVDFDIKQTTPMKKPAAVSSRL